MRDDPIRGCPASGAAPTMLVLALLLHPGWTPACERSEPAAKSADAPGGTAVSALAEVTSAEWPHLTVRVTSAARVSPHAVRVDLEFANAPGGATAIGFGASFASAPEDADTIADVFLFDPERGRKYFVLRDDAGRPRCSAKIAPVAPGSRLALWSVFPAPPSDVTTITVHVPHVGSLDRVPIG